jgi:hypothetical protein
MVPASTVRELAGIAFPGTAPTRLLRLGDVKTPGLLEDQSKWRDGRPPFPPLDGGYFRTITLEPYPAGFDRGAGSSEHQLERALRRWFGDIPT